MSRDVLIAIDAGGTAVKVAGFDLDGNEIAHGQATVHTGHHPDGRVERDVETFWQGIAAAVHEVTDQCRGRRILGVGCTGFGNGIFLLDEQGRGIRPGIVSIDHRAQPIVDRLNASKEAAAMTSRLTRAHSKNMPISAARRSNSASAISLKSSIRMPRKP